nr:glycosyltransferase [Arthrobacter stackebrandtii]
MELLAARPEARGWLRGRARCRRRAGRAGGARVKNGAPGRRPALSIVVPVYNVAPWLDECLNSLRSQSFSDLEIVVVNDGSTDSSGAIARRHAQADARVTVHDFANGGLGRARNRGLELCRGSYVLFTDSDDRVPSGAVAAMMAQLQESGSDLVTGRAVDFYTDPEKYSDYWTTVSSVFTRSRQGVTLAAHPELIHDHTVWNKVYSLAFLQEHGIRFSEDTLCEDVYFCAQAYAKAVSVDIVSDYVYEHRRRRGAISNSLGDAKPLTDWMAETQKVLGLLTDQPAAVRDAYVSRLLRIEAFDRARWVDAGTPQEVKAALAQLVAGLLDLGSAEAVRAVPQRHLAVLESLRLEVLSASRPRMEAPQLSVVVPTLNVERWIDDCLLSIRRQDFANLEIIVVDDGSEDKTVNAIAEHLRDDPRIHYVRSYGAGGGTARNTGTDAARGEFLAFADGDDMVPQGAYTRFIEQLERSGSDMAVGDYLQLSKDGVWHPHWKNKRFSVLREAITIAQFPELVMNRCCWDKMFRRQFWDRSGNFFPDARRANDIAPMVRAYVGAASLDVVPGPSYVYRKRPGNSSMTAKASNPASLQNYLEQELACARMVLATHSPELAQAYFSAVAERDLWVHLKGFLASGGARNPLVARPVFDAAASLLRVVPRSYLAALEPTKKLVYQLLLSGNTGPLANARRGALDMERGGIGALFPWKDALIVSADEHVQLELRRQAYSRGVLNRLVNDWPRLPEDQRRLARARVVRFAGANIGRLGSLHRSPADRVRFTLIAAGSTGAIGAVQALSGKGHPKRRMWRMLNRQPLAVQRVVRQGWKTVQRAALAVSP